MPLTILPNKLEVPSLGEKILDRPELRKRLADALLGRTTLVAADAGFGKSTLVADFLARSDRPAIWYRLETSDNDPVNFATHLLHGLRPHIPPQAYTSARRGLTLASNWSAALQLLGPVIHRLRHDVVIVLDDLHLLHDPDIAAPMTRWIEGLPSRAHVAILTRVVPSFPLARWQTHGHLIVFGPEDLRFTLPELRALLVDLHGLPLTDASLQVLAARTEGWAAGVMLALHAAATQGTALAAQTLGAISGSTREIYDYLAQEAFTRQTAETQRFLLATASVERFSLPLATALLQITAGQCRGILDHLEASNLFIVLLDRERRWYRYHHLFQEFLRRIGSDRDPAWIREIHLAAARWWEGNGDVDQALHHLIAGQALPQAAAMLGAVGVEMVPQGRIETVSRWLNQIPTDEWDAAPRLFLIRGLIDVISGETGESARFLEEARRRLRGRDPEGEMYALRWLVNAVMWQGGLDLLTPLLPSIDELGTRLANLTPTARAVAEELAARVAMLQGDLSTAERRFDEAVGISRASGDEWTYLGCVRYQNEMLFTQGDFHRAVAQFEELLALSNRRGWWHEHAHLQVELAQALGALGADDEAGRHLTEARVLLPTIPCRVLAADLAITSARAATRRYADDLAEAQLRELLGAGTHATHYRAFRYDAQTELALLLRHTHPQEARALASGLVHDAEHFGAFRRARGLHAAAVATDSPELGIQAAERFSALGAEPWQALSLLHAAALTPPANAAVAAATTTVLHGLREETWQFLFAQVPPALLSPFVTDPIVGPRIQRMLDTAPLPAPPRIVVRCLGQFEVMLDNRKLGPTAWKRAAPRRLFQFLLLQDRPVHREEISEALWPNQEPRHAANQLRVALSQLRRTLEPALIANKPSAVVLTTGPMVVLARDRLDIDLDRLRASLAKAADSSGPARRAALEEAAALYAGDLFADHPFEEWAELDRERLRTRCIGALAALAEIDESAGDHESAIRRWHTVVDYDPGAEQAYRGLMRSYRSLGRMAEALRAFEGCRQALADLGALPSPETLALRHSLDFPQRTSPG
ncbi:MAG TPA: BTAD domain-containing putative transcriptional regulator [bacterium]